MLHFARLTAIVHLRLRGGLDLNGVQSDFCNCIIISNKIDKRFPSQLMTETAGVVRQKELVIAVSCEYICAYLRNLSLLNLTGKKLGKI